MPDDEPSESLPALPGDDVERVITLLQEAGEVHPDLGIVLGEPDPDRVIDELFRDEVHARRT